MSLGQDKPVTIYDVAAEAGVAASTVSRTFSRPDRVSSATARKVLDTAQRIGYRQQLDTRPKNKPTTQAIGLVIADVTNPFFHEIFRGAQHAAGIENYTVLATESAGSVPRALQAVKTMTPLVDALLLASTRLTNGEILKIARTLPTVCISHPVQGVPSVLIDNYAGATTLAHHLYAQGARSLTYLSGPSDSWADRMRWRGLSDASSATLSVDPSMTRLDYPPDRISLNTRSLQVDEPTIRGGRRAFETWRANPTDAVVCFNNMVALGFMDQARTTDLKIPEEVLVAAFDNTEFAQLNNPSLTTVAGPSRSVGRVAAANALAVAKGLRSPLTKPRVLPTRLIVRASTSR